MKRPRWPWLLVASVCLLGLLALFSWPQLASAEIRSVTPSEITVAVGGVATAEVKVTHPQGGSCLLALRPQGPLPPGMNITFTPPCGEGDGTHTMTVSVAAEATDLEGSHQIGVIETDPAGTRPLPGVFQLVVVVTAPEPVTQPTATLEPAPTPTPTPPPVPLGPTEREKGGGGGFPWIPVAAGIGAGVALAAIVAACWVWLMGIWDFCPHLCEPEGAVQNCTWELLLDTSPCGVPPNYVEDVLAGAELMRVVSKRALKLPALGATYAAFLEAMPGWVKVADKLVKEKTGSEAYVTVICRWEECTLVRCWVLWKRREWIPKSRAYGPYRLTVPAGYARTDNCFAPGLSAEDLYAAIAKAIERNDEINNATTECEAICA